MSAGEQRYNALLVHLRRLRRRGCGLTVAAGLLRLLAAALALGALWVGLEALFYLPPPWRSALGGAAALGAGLVCVLYLRRRLPARLSLRRLALLVESRCPQLEQRLISALELWPGRRARPLYSPALLEATLAQSAEILERLDPRQVFDPGEIKAAARRLALGLLPGLALLVLFGTEMGAALGRCAHPFTPFTRPVRTRIAAEPGDLEVVRGEDAFVRLYFGGERPRSARILRRETPQAAWQHEEVFVDRVDSFAYAFKQVRRPFAYRVEAGDGRSPLYQVSVIDPPAVRRLRLRYHYPDYSGLAARVEEEDGDISALPGTVVRFEIAASKALSAAAVVIDDSLRLPASVQDRSARAQLRLEHPGHYYIELRDRKGVANRDPIRYHIDLLEDEPPRAAIADPGRDSDLPESMQVALGIEAEDDFGVDSLALVWRLDTGGEQRRRLPLRPGRQVRLNYLWDLGAQDLLPEDRVHYRVEVFDNDIVSGPKKGASREYLLRFPSLYELFEEVTREQEEGVETLEELGREEEKASRHLEQVRRELLKTRELSWEQKKELEAALDQEAARVESAEELSRQLNETIAKLEKNGLASEALLDKLQELRELMATVTTPEMQQALEALQRALEVLKPGELAEALKEFGADQEAFQQRLDRTLDLLRQIHSEQQLEAAVQQAAELEKRQEQIDAALERGAEERLPRRESSLERDAERLRRELGTLGENEESFGEETARQLGEEAAAMEARDLSGRMQQMVQSLKARQSERAQRLGRGLEEELGALAAQLQHVQGEFIAGKKQQLGRELQKALGDLLYLSRRQEELKAQQQVHREDAAEGAQAQFALVRATGLAIERIARVGRQTMSLESGLGATLGYVLQSMQQAAQFLSQREAARAGEPQKKAMGYLNESALLLRRSLDNLENARMPSGFAEAMQKMMGLSEQQAALNQATQQALAPGVQPGSGGRGGEELRARMARLAAEQRRIYQALGELERALRGQRGARRRTRAIQEEMKPVLRDLEGRRPSRRTLEAQRGILQQMLEASASIHVRGFEKKRRARQGESMPYTGPSGLPEDLGQSYDYVRQAMKSALEGPYPEEYRALIQRYYELVYQDLINQEKQP